MAEYRHAREYNKGRNTKQFQYPLTSREQEINE